VMNKIREVHPETIVLNVNGLCHNGDRRSRRWKPASMITLSSPLDINRIKMIIKRGVEEQRLGIENRELLAS